MSDCLLSKERGHLCVVVREVTSGSVFGEGERQTGTPDVVVKVSKISTERESVSETRQSAWKKRKKLWAVRE
jgi:hypothetical protein